MPIQVECPECEHSLRLRDELAGKRIRCNRCSCVLRVPASSVEHAAQRPAPKRRSDGGSGRQQSGSALGDTLAKANPETFVTASETDTDVYNRRYEQFLNAFTARRIEPIPIAGTYRFAILVVSAFMVMLPFLYLGTIAVLAFLMPCVMLPLLLFLIVKPLFSSMGPPTGRRSLKRDDEPLLFDFVDRICEAVNAPYPKQINIDSQVNASASFRRGALSMFGNDMTLTIGMPLVAGLNTRQLAGVLAHEFGHFSQGAGMRLSYVIRFMSMWFTRIVYERDRFDDFLERLSEEVPAPLNVFFYAIRGMVWFCRRIMWVFMKLGHLVAGYMLRQMEFDADQREARLAGTKCFAQTARRLIHMTVAHQGAIADLQVFYREGRLADNLPRLIIANVDQLDARARQKIRRHVNKAETGLFDTHPCDRDRVNRVRQQQHAGIFRLERPAEELFRRYDYQARQVTWDMYQAIFGNEVRKTDLHPVDQLLVRLEFQKANFEALFRFFQCAPAWYRALPSPDIALQAPRDPRAAASRVRDARERMLDLAEGYGVGWKKYDRAEMRLTQCELAESLLKARLRVPKGLFDVPLNSYDDIEKREDAASYIQSKQEPLLRPFEDAAAERLYSALRLLRLPAMRKRLPHQEALAREVAELVPLFAQVNSRLSQLLAIRNDHIRMGLLVSMIQGNESNRRLFRHIHETMEHLDEAISDLDGVLDQVPYPFDHAHEDITLARFMLSELPDPENPVELLVAAESIGDSLPTVQSRVLGRLCQIAEEVETALGLEPLPQPELPDDEEDEEDQG